MAKKISYAVLVLMLGATLVFEYCSFIDIQAAPYSFRKQFHNIDELRGLIKKARDAGMSEQEIRGITIPYDESEITELIINAKDAGMSDADLKKILPEGGKEIIVIDYIHLIETLEHAQDQKLKEFLSKKFLTVNDVFNELVVSEPEAIQKLREKLVSDR